MTHANKVMAEKYQLAERLVFAKMQPWQKEAVIEDRRTGHDTRLLHQFCSDVIKTAEEMVIAPPSSKPPVVSGSRQSASKA